MAIAGPAISEARDSKSSASHLHSDWPRSLRRRTRSWLTGYGFEYAGSVMALDALVKSVEVVYDV